MKRDQILFFTLLVFLFCPAGCKGKGKTKPADSKATVVSKAAATGTAKEAAVAEDDEEDDAPFVKGKEEKLTGVYAAATKREPETKDDPSRTPTFLDFEEEAAAKITALNFGEELKAIEELLEDMDDEDTEDVEED